MKIFTAVVYAHSVLNIDDKTKVRAAYSSWWFSQSGDSWIIPFLY
jgi:hypothetical protein